MVILKQYVVWNSIKKMYGLPAIRIYYKGYHKYTSDAFKVPNNTLDEVMREAIAINFAYKKSKVIYTNWFGQLK